MGESITRDALREAVVEAYGRVPELIAETVETTGRIRVGSAIKPGCVWSQAVGEGGTGGHEVIPLDDAIRRRAGVGLRNRPVLEVVG